VQCGTPAAREEGGHAGGGLCTLGIVGEHDETSLGLVGLGVGAALFARRRSRRS
jgi:hypothetical protein